MLVLTRKRDEIIDIGGDIEIMVVEIRGDKVRLGIKAPQHIKVHRREVTEAIAREGAEAHDLARRTAEASRKKKKDALLRIARELKKTMQCNCDLDTWEPEKETGHSFVCRIHIAAKARIAAIAKEETEANELR